MKTRLVKGMMKRVYNILRAIEPADVCSIQIWKPPAIDECVPNDACLDSSDADIPGMEILLIELKKILPVLQGPRTLEQLSHL